MVVLCVLWLCGGACWRRRVWSLCTGVGEEKTGRKVGGEGRGCGVVQRWCGGVVVCEVSGGVVM